MKKNNFYKILVTLTLLVASCATTNMQKTVVRNDCMLFPYGTYKQSVAVKFDKRTMKFKGVLQKNKAAKIIYGLSSFDTTIFRIKDDRSGKIELTLYNEKLLGKEDKIKDIYQTLNNILDAEQCVNTEKTMVINKGTEQNSIKIEFKEFDNNKIPIITKLFNENYEVTIRTEDYEI